jgi:glycosyltransferase involved in cell wall biosynthesis
MRLMFIHYVLEDRGSAQDMYNYAQVARTLGHEVVLYGRPRNGSAFDYSLDVDSADAAIFIFEWTTGLQDGDHVDIARLIGRIPRRRRVVIDCDGGYNDAISVTGDVNHRDVETSRQWISVCDSLSEKIYQPTYHPLRPNVRTFFFHAYNPAWEQPLELTAKDYGMVYVGNNWFRWRSLHRVLQALEPLRDKVGRIALVGNGWDRPAPWAKPNNPRAAYENDPEYLRRLDVEVVPPIRFDEVITWMGKGVFTPVVLRPLFDHLQLVTCRTFETVAANVIPLFAQDPRHVREIYGDEAAELVLPDARPHEKIAELLARPEHYARIVQGMRRRLARKYSYEVQLRQLIDIVNG